MKKILLIALILIGCSPKSEKCLTYIKQTWPGWRVYGEIEENVRFVIIDSSGKVLEITMKESKSPEIAKVKTLFLLDTVSQSTKQIQ